jgi:hypothetical protein
MTFTRFPTRRADHSFVVYARFVTSDTDIIDLVRQYVSVWARVNQVWTRIWRSDSIREERLEFNAEFLSEPRLENSDDASTFSIVLECRPAAQKWKEWVVSLVDDVCRVFPEVKFERFDS